MAASSKGASRRASSTLKKGDSDKVVFYHDWCKQCGICVSFCPKEALAMDEEGYPQLVAPERCGSCGLCEVLCPDFAITVPKRRRPAKRERSKKRNATHTT